MVSEEFPNIYHYFGLEQGASQEAITREYSRLVRLYHSPKNGEKPKKPQEIKTFTRIQDCYNILSNPTKRRQYDNRLEDAQTRRNIQIERLRAPQHPLSDAFLEEHGLTARFHGIDESSDGPVLDPWQRHLYAMYKYTELQTEKHEKEEQQKRQQAEAEKSQAEPDKLHDDSNQESGPTLTTRTAKGN